MFLYDLPRPQQEAFLKLAHHLIHADDHFAVEEEAMLELLRREMALQDASSEAEVKVADLLAHFDSPESRTAALLELLIMAYSDGELNEREAALINEVARRFDVEKEDLAYMENWANRQVALAQEGHSLITEASK